jgi:hypothetical protein
VRFDTSPSGGKKIILDDERIARCFHYEYERLAPQFGWSTQEASRQAWEDVPEENRALMCNVVRCLLESDVIRPGQHADLKG